MHVETETLPALRLATLRHVGPSPAESGAPSAGCTES